jgi:hypothetical protein
VPELATHDHAHDHAHEHRTLRDIADDLLEYQRVEYIYDGQLSTMAAPGFTRSRILNRITSAFHGMWAARLTAVEWEWRAGDFQFDRVDEPDKFFLPDLAIAHPGSRGNREFRTNIALIVEVTSPKSPDTAKNDRGIKPKRYAEAGVPATRWSIRSLESGPSTLSKATGRATESTAAAATAAGTARPSNCLSRSNAPFPRTSGPLTGRTKAERARRGQEQSLMAWRMAERARDESLAAW